MDQVADSVVVEVAGAGGGGGRAVEAGARGRRRRGGRGQNARRGPITVSTPVSAIAGRNHSYNGSVSLTAQNSVLNAAPFSLNGFPSNKPYSSTNNFTATVGGPMVIPRLVNWPRASFNITYQGSLNRNGSNLLGAVPTAAEREGDFSQTTTALAGIPDLSIYDPLSGTPFPGNAIPVAHQSGGEDCCRTSPRLLTRASSRITA